MALNHARAGRVNAAPVDEIEALRRLFQAHQRGVFSLLIHLGQDESQAAALTQEVFASVWNGRHWIGDDDERVVTCYRQALVSGRSAAEHPAPIAAGGGPVTHALRELPEEERVAVVLSHIANLHPREVARVLQVSE